jgi:hypothetical protein
MASHFSSGDIDISFPPSMLVICSGLSALNRQTVKMTNPRMLPVACKPEVFSIA